jgi:large subunit ribosomal protein L25
MELIAQKRDILGKAVKNLREKGFIPAELYGHGVKNKHLTVAAKDFKLVFEEAGESTMIDLHVGEERMPVMIHDVSRDSVSDEVINIDFYQVRLDEKIIVAVPLIFLGEAPAVKDQQGILVKSLHEVELQALPTNIPREITVSLESLTEIGKSIYVKDLAIPENVELEESLDTVVASVTERVEEDEAPQEAIDVDSVKVEGEEKVAERQAKKETTEEITKEE